MKYLKNGDEWTPTTDGQLDLRDTLERGVYVVGKKPMQPYHLERTADFILPSKLYGNTVKHSERIISTFKGRREQTGVLLSGVKGSGKTMLAKHLAMTSGFPTIIVNNPYCDESFLLMLQGIDQEAVIIFDEFEKMYNKESQEKILTLFDGVFTAQRKIIILTCNNKHEVRDFFHNRPSRLRYSIEFEGLGTDFIKEYCQDHLKDLSLLEDILKMVPTCMDFNFDMLQHLVDELNLYGGPLSDVTEILNVKPYLSRQSAPKWTITVLDQDNEENKWSCDETLSTSPMRLFSSREDIYLTVTQTVPPPKKDEDGDLVYVSYSLELNRSHLKGVSRDGDIYQFKIKEEGHNFEILVQKAQSEVFDWGTF